MRQMIQHMLINEEEMQDEIVEAAQRAISDFKWREELSAMVKRELEGQISELLRGVIRSLHYEPELKPLFTKMMLKAIEEHE